MFSGRSVQGFAIVIALAAWGPAAYAGGSIALTDAMANFDAPPALIDEI